MKRKHLDKEDVRSKLIDIVEKGEFPLDWVSLPISMAYAAIV